MTKGIIGLLLAIVGLFSAGSAMADPDCTALDNARQAAWEDYQDAQNASDYYWSVTYSYQATVVYWVYLGLLNNCGSDAQCAADAADDYDRNMREIDQAGADLDNAVVDKQGDAFAANMAYVSVCS